MRADLERLITELIALLASLVALLEAWKR